MGDEEQASAQRLRTHVEQLAGEIGERNVFHPQALQAAASCIERQCEQQGYTVERLARVMRGLVVSLSEPRNFALGRRRA